MQPLHLRWARNGAIIAAVFLAIDQTDWRGTALPPWSADTIGANVSYVGGYIIGGALFGIAAAFIRRLFTREP